MILRRKEFKYESIEKLFKCVDISIRRVRSTAWKTIVRRINANEFSHRKIDEIYRRLLMSFLLSFYFFSTPISTEFNEGRATPKDC